MYTFKFILGVVLLVLFIVGMVIFLRCNKVIKVDKKPSTTYVWKLYQIYLYHNNGYVDTTIARLNRIKKLPNEFLTSIMDGQLVIDWRANTIIKGKTELVSSIIVHRCRITSHYSTTMNPSDPTAIAFMGLDIDEDFVNRMFMFKKWINSEGFTDAELVKVKIGHYEQRFMLKILIALLTASKHHNCIMKGEAIIAALREHKELSKQTIVDDQSFYLMVAEAKEMSKWQVT